MTEPGATLPPATRQRLEKLRHALLRLHRVLLDDERAAYERSHGRISAGEALQLLLNHPQFAWLRSISELVVQVDEVLESKEPGTHAAANALFKQARSLFLPATTEGAFRNKYHDALQRLPDVVLAHRDVTAALADG